MNKTRKRYKENNKKKNSQRERQTARRWKWEPVDSVAPCVSPDPGIATLGV